MVSLLITVHSYSFSLVVNQLGLLNRIAVGEKCRPRQSELSVELFKGCPRFVVKGSFKKDAIAVKENLTNTLVLIGIYRSVGQSICLFLR